MPNKIVERSLLSQREDEIIELAIEGLTDVEIGLQLGIAVSTVSTYWGRIRGKLGPMSRTELVATTLKKKAKENLDLLNEKSKELDEITQRQNRLGPDSIFADRYRLALEALPEALVVLDESGRIIFSNQKLGRLFGYELQELLGESIAKLISHRFREEEKMLFDKFLAHPLEQTRGVNQVLYGVRRDGSELRIILFMDAQSSVGRTTISVIVKPFADEADWRRRVANTNAVSYARPLNLPSVGTAKR